MRVPYVFGTKFKRESGLGSAGAADDADTSDAAALAPRKTLRPTLFGLQGLLRPAATTEWVSAPAPALIVVVVLLPPQKRLEIGECEELISYLGTPPLWLRLMLI